MKNIETPTTNEIITLLTELLKKQGYDVELECIRTFHADQYYLQSP
jgi:hypothetical protein